MRYKDPIRCRLCLCSHPAACQTVSPRMPVRAGHDTSGNDRSCRAGFHPTPTACHSLPRSGIQQVPTGRQGITGGCNHRYPKALTIHRAVCSQSAEFIAIWPPAASFWPSPRIMPLAPNAKLKDPIPLPDLVLLP